MDKHTPTPWVIEPDLPAPYMEQARIYAPRPDGSRSSSGHLIASVGNAAPELQDQWEADAQFIVLAVNAHDALLAALNDVISAYDRLPEYSTRPETNYADLIGAIGRARAALSGTGPA